MLAENRLMKRSARPLAVLFEKNQFFDTGLTSTYFNLLKNLICEKKNLFFFGKECG
jgi:hypothetical protein